MRIAIVDDIPAEREELSGQVSAVMYRQNYSGVVLEFADGASFLAAAHTEPFDLVFLDIYMQGLDGVETARRLRELDEDCTIVFVTISPDHALDGYGVWAMQYLVKPYGREQIEAVFSQLEQYKPSLEKSIRIPVGRQELSICLRDIQWAENCQHQVHIHMAHGKILTVRMTFANFVALLDGDNRFLVCHRGVLVNLAYVADFDEHVFCMKDGVMIPVSRSLVKIARSSFSSYLFERRR